MKTKENMLYNKVPGSDFEHKVYNYKRRIIFSKLLENGIEDMYEFEKIPIYFKYLNGYSPHTSIDDTRDYFNILKERINNGYMGGKSMYWFLRLKTTNKVIGTFGLVGLCFNSKSATIGKGLSPDYWGQGLMFEALWVALKFCFEDLGLETITTLTSPDNKPNIQLMKTVGAKEVGEKSFITPDGKESSLIVLTLKKDEAQLKRCLAFARIASV